MNNMNTLLDDMYKKRFCLPANADITRYEKGNLHINNCLCGSYNHIACVLKAKGKGDCPQG